MFFALSKIAALVLKPIVWTVVASLAAFLLRTKRPVSSRWCAVTAGLIIVIFSNPLLLNVALKVWEIPAVPPAHLTAPYDVGILLGGYSNFRDFLPDSWTLWQWEFLIREWVGVLAYRLTDRA